MRPDTSARLWQVAAAGMVMIFQDQTLICFSKAFGPLKLELNFQFCRVSDPYSFFPDPDPAFEARDQSGSGSGSNPDPGL